MKIIIVLQIFFALFSSYLSARDYKLLEKISNILITTPRLADIEKIIPSGSRILLYDKNSRSLMIQEETGACYALFESEKSIANHRFGKIIMTDPWNVELPDGSVLVWNYAVIDSISEKQIVLSIIRNNNKSKKNDQLVLLRDDTIRNSIWQLNSPP